MPNTLVHLGVHGLANQALVRNIDLKWVFLGAIIPDMPWILRRAVHVLAPGIDPYDLINYATAQASLAVSLLLCGALAVLAARPRQVFLILAVNSLLHLLLDAIEIKFGNGVHLAAPFSWELLSFNLVWPDSPAIYLLTALGLVYAFWSFGHLTERPVNVYFRSSRRVSLAILFLAAYGFVPLVLVNGPEAQDNHSVSTLRHKSARPGREVLMDRRPFRIEQSSSVVQSFAGEELKVTGEVTAPSGTVSIRGRFVDSETIWAYELHQQHAWFRDGASYIGLSLVVMAWMLSLVRRRSVDEERLAGKGQG